MKDFNWTEPGCNVLFNDNFHLLSYTEEDVINIKVPLLNQMALNHVPDTNKNCWTVYSVFIPQVGPWLTNKIHILCHNIFCFWLADVENLRE